MSNRDDIGAFRLASGGLVDRAAPVGFTFDGRRYTGLKGDTLASALLAHGVRLVGRSFKYHRPRGIVSCGSEEPNALVELRPGEGRHEPNSRATMVELYDGLAAQSQNRFPSLGFDILALNQLLGRFIPAGFYYKTFMGPTKGAWMWFEPFIRRAAGLGRASLAADPDRYESMHAFCDVLVVGAGPAGLMAARVAAEAGLSVILADEHPVPGGALKGTNATIEGRAGHQWASRQIDELTETGHVRVLPRTTVWGYFDHNVLGAVERVADHVATPAPGEPRQRGWTIRAQHVVLATGAIERPVVFPNNDRPGVMLASAARQYLHRFAVLPGRRALVVANTDSAYAAAFDLAQAGLSVPAIADLRAQANPDLVERAQALGIAVHTGHGVVDVAGGRAVTGVAVGALDDRGAPKDGASKRIDCDTVLMSGGWSPTVHLAKIGRAHV